MHKHIVEAVENIVLLQYFGKYLYIYYYCHPPPTLPLLFWYHNFIIIIFIIWSRNSAIDAVIRLRVGRFGLRIPAGARYFPRLHNIRTWSWAHPPYYSLGTGVISRGLRDRRVKLNAVLHLLPRSRMNGAIPLLPVYAFKTWTKTISPLQYIHNQASAGSRNQMFGTSNINTNTGHCTKLGASTSCIYISPPPHPFDWSILFALLCVSSVLSHNASLSSCCLHSFRIRYTFW